MDDNKFWILIWMVVFGSIVCIAGVIGYTQYKRDKMFVEAGYVQTYGHETCVTGIHWEKK